MGNDGGSISRVKALQIAKADSHDKLQNSESQRFDTASKWSVCRLTSLPLQLPLVSDYQGNIFNKESVLEWLLTPDREDYTADQIRLFAHIKSLKDVVELHNMIPEAPDGGKAALRCDVGDEIWGKSSGSFAYVTDCGHVLPLRMLRQDCPVCNVKCSDSNIIVLNPKPDQLSTLESRMRELRQKGLTHSGKPLKTKKRRAKKGENEVHIVKRRAT
ncbi:LADA_0D12750g1_1 [Lachancea dasiensis]|uniref:LADA_0D12750g1_1 n=1 Tax=Lachancea dasiensis TaxID=1072105 RepID=A0A1G4J8C7_9SACH|nr:LADA_0D12750g1_1 [Lachancea dasiensis]